MVSLYTTTWKGEKMDDLSPNSTIFSCSSSGRGLYIQAWDLTNSSVLRTYKSETDGEASCMCRAGRYLLCAVSSKPFIFIWLISKVIYKMYVSYARDNIMHK